MSYGELIIFKQRVEDLEMRCDVYEKLLRDVCNFIDFDAVVQSKKAEVMQERANKMQSNMARRFPKIFGEP